MKAEQSSGHRETVGQPGIEQPKGQMKGKERGRESSGATSRKTTIE